jgi:hypothetical protein
MATELKRETKDRTRLVLSKLDNPRKRADGKRANYAIDVHYLSATGGVLGNDYGLFTAKEIAPILAGQSMFDVCDLQ